MVACGMNWEAWDVWLLFMHDVGITGTFWLVCETCTKCE